MITGVLGLGQISRGVAEGLAGVAALAAVMTSLTSAIPQPSPALLRDMASLGIVLVLAYVVEAVWLVPRMGSEPDYENRLGAITGIGLAGMIGVAAALALSAHRAAGHDNAVDAIGFAWTVSSLGLLAAMVTLQPLLVHDWEDPRSAPSDDSGPQQGAAPD